MSPYEIIFTILLAIIGWLAVNKLTSIDKSLEYLKTVFIDHEKRITTLETRYGTRESKGNTEL